MYGNIYWIQEILLTLNLSYRIVGEKISIRKIMAFFLILKEHERNIMTEKVERYKDDTPVS